VAVHSLHGMELGLAPEFGVEVACHIPRLEGYW
jgi:hypothetical protein